MDGDENGGYFIDESKNFQADVRKLCAEIRVAHERIETIINVVRLAVLRNPQNLQNVPNQPNMKFVFTMRVNRDGIQVPSLRVLIKINETEHRIELLALTSRDVRL